MARILDHGGDGRRPAVPPLQHVPRTQGGAIAYAATAIGDRLGATALVSFTQTGDTVRRLSRHHCRIPLLAFTPEPAVRSQLALSWGVETFVSPTVQHTDEMVRAVDDGDAGERARPARRPGGDRGRQPAVHAGLDEHAPRAPPGRACDRG